MAYVGRIVALCENGHMSFVDPAVVKVVLDSDSWRALPRCKALIRGIQCRKPWKYRYSLDDTNGEKPLPKLKPIAQEDFHTCACGNSHLRDSARYVPDSDDPEQDGWKSRFTPRWAQTG